MAKTPDFKYAPMFQIGEDKTEYRLISKEGVSTAEFEGKTILKVSKEALTLLAQQGFHDVEFMLRREHNLQVAKILSLGQAMGAVMDSGHSRVFVFDDWVSRQNFWKQFFSGVFIVVVMTGLDQDMMQKNLTCKTLREAQKDMCSYGVAFLPANALFLSLGVLLMMLAQRTGVDASGDQLLPAFAASGELGMAVVVFFTIGIVAASFSSADSALTSLTTSFCVDIRGRANDERLRHRVHVGMAVVFALFILLFRVFNNTSLLDAIYVMCSYTYGPLLGMFGFVLLTRRTVRDRWVPYIAVASPLICFGIDTTTTALCGYHFGYELLMLNGLLTFAGMWAVSHKGDAQPHPTTGLQA